MPGLCLANGTERSTDWNRVNWRKVYRQVSNLRQRIFRASHTGDHKKARSLQKLMLRSHANTFLSVRRVTQGNAGKNTAGIDKLVVKTPAARKKLVEHLSTYQPWKAKPARRVYIPKPMANSDPWEYRLLLTDAFKQKSKPPWNGIRNAFV